MRPVLVIDKSAPTSAHPVSVWSAVYTDTGGRQVRLDEYNAPTATPPPSRPEPALSMAQLGSVVSSRSRHRVIGAARPVATPTTGTGVAGAPRPADVLATADRLLPAGVRHDNGSTPQTGPGAAHLAVTADGRTGALVITVDPRPEQGAGDPRRAFEGGVRSGRQLTRTADGSSVISPADGSGCDPAACWTVEAMLPDGTGVGIAETNGDNAHAHLPGTPVLDVARLVAMATDPGWRQHRVVGVVKSPLTGPLPAAPGRVARRPARGDAVTINW